MMNEQTIRIAVQSASKGIDQYLEIMALLNEVNVSTDRDFQRKFNAFYRMRQRAEKFYQEYFNLLESLKGSKPTFSYVLSQLLNKTSRHEASFSSKLLATLDVNAPIWDRYVLQNLGIQPPPVYSKNRFQEIVAAYNAILKWYSEYLRSSEGRAIIKVFNECCCYGNQISDTKKIDFVLWQTRS